MEPFLGRTAALCALQESLSDPKRRSILIYGSLGNGKGSLLRRAWRDPDVRQANPDGVVWLDGATTYPWLLANLPPALKSSMRAPHSYQRVEKSLRNAQALLLISNGATHERLCQEVAELQRGGNIRVAWLEDEELDPNADIRLGVEGLLGASGDTTTTVGLAEAVLARPLSDQEGNLWSNLARRLLGNPLALRLLAGAMRHDSSILEAWPGEGRLAVATVVQQLHSLLDTELRRALDILLLSREPIPEAMALQLTGIHRAQLRGLVGLGWLQYNNSGRLWVTSALRRLIPRLASEARSAQNQLEPWVRLIDSSLDHGLEVGFSPATLTQAAMGLLWDAALNHGELEKWLTRRERINHWARQTGQLGLMHAWNETLLRERGAVEPAGVRARLHFSLAVALNDPPNLDQAVAHLEQGLLLSAGDPELQNSGFETLGAIQVELGNYTKAHQAYQSGLELAKRTGRPKVYCSNLEANIAFIKLLLGETAGLEEPLRNTIATKAAERRVGSSLPNMNALGLLLLALERFDEAIEVLIEAQQQNDRLHDQTFGVYILHALAASYLEQGDLPNAYNSCLRALETSVPEMHDQVITMVHSTRLRIAIRSAPKIVSASDLNQNLNAYASAPMHLRRYAALTAASYRAEVTEEPHIAKSWLELLLSQPLEAHLATMARRLLARLPKGSDEAAAGATFGSLEELWPHLYATSGVADGANDRGREAGEL